jgi:gliding motility-associated-like protein
MRSFFFAFLSAVLLVFLLVCNTQYLYAQAPVINYTSPHTYLINKPIFPLAPKNTGGAVPATIYGTASIAVGPGNFSIVAGVTTEAAGNIYVGDFDRNIIYKVTPSGNSSIFAGSGSIGYADGLGAAASFYEPDALVMDNNGNLYVSDLGNALIRKITPDGLVTTFAGKGQVLGSANGTGSEARFSGPRGLAVDAAGNVYVADQGNNLIRKITAGGVVTTYAGNGNAGFTNANGTAATFNTPTGVGLDVSGNLYVTDAGNNAIRKITPARDVTTFATGLSFPREVRADGTGNLYVTDQSSSTVKRISPTGVVTTLSGSFSSPIGLVLDGKGNLFLAQNGNGLIRKIIISGYTIDKALPTGLIFDPKTGIITGTPTVLWPATNYTVTAYNGGGSNSTIVNLEVALSVILKSSVINFPPPVKIKIDADNILHPEATSTNTETPITYTSSNPAVAYLGADGQIHVIAPGITIITASQQGNENYNDAAPVSVPYTITQDQVIVFPAIAVKKTCDADFFVGAVSSNSTIQLTYFSNNLAVATVSGTGNIHIMGPGNATITVSQGGSNLYNEALPVSQTLTVNPLITPSVKISPDFYSSCDGLLLTYTATPTNGGNNPTYQWRLNGNNTGDNSAVYASTTLKTGDVITCIVTNNDQCTPVSSPVSNPGSLSADPNVTMGLVITSSVTTTVDVGTPITFKATASANVQIVPAYTWMVNGQIAGTNSATFTSNTLSDGDMVTCSIFVDGKCIVNPSVTSNSITVSISIPEKIIIPNAFTPNGDGSNDTWSIAALLSYPNCTVSIYNRYGEAVYQSKGYQHPWDGRLNGKQLPVGTYYYIIDPQRDSQKLSGPVTILR